MRIEDFRTEFKHIKCGVPQGAVLSPTLFSIYINDIPTMFDKNKAYSLLFADDLVNFFIFNKSGQMETKVKNYIKNLKIWLKKWKLQMHPKKCNSIVFNKSSDKSMNNKFKFKLNNDYIPSCNSIKFLGLTFDLGLTFTNHVKDIKKKCINRLNVIKILSNKKWKLSKKTQNNNILSIN